MSLKVEQRLSGEQITEFFPKIFSTGVHLIPMKIIEKDKEKFIWVANEFTEDTYLDGDIVSPNIIADKIETLYD
jgi:hypothetical protein